MPGRVNAFALAAAMLCFGLSFSLPVQAASFFFQTPKTEVGLQEEILVTLIFDGQGEEANALEGVLAYDPGLFRLVSIRDAHSVIPLWVEDPAVSVSRADGKIRFSGIAPGGIGEPLGAAGAEASGTVFEATFRALAPSEGAVFSVKDASALRHDGSGSALALSTPSLTLVINAEEAASPSPTEEDSMPPAPFEPLLTRDASLFDGDWFLVFSARDQGSGIGHYEVQEGNGPFVFATSPYRLTDQTLRGPITVKAVDRNGNATLAEVSPSHEPSSLRTTFWCMMVAVFVLLFLWLYRRRSRS